MGDRERLAELCAAYYAFSLLTRDPIQVKMEAACVVAHKEKCALAECADVNLRHWALVQPPDIAGRDCRTVLLAFEQHHLHSGEDLTRPVTAYRCAGAVREWLREHQQLKTRGDREPGDLIDAKPR